MYKNTRQINRSIVRVMQMNITNDEYCNVIFLLAKHLCTISQILWIIHE